MLLKKIICFLLVFIFALLYTGCNGTTVEPISNKTVSSNDIISNNGNVANLGLVAQSNNHIYYSKTVDDTNFGLYRLEIDTENIIKINEDVCNYINVDSNNIYYIVEGDYHLYKTDLYGNNKAKLSDDLCGYLNLIDNWLYYINYSDGEKIYKMKSDGTEVTRVNDYPSARLVTDDKFIYYCRISEEIASEGADDAEFNPSGELYKISIKDGEETKVTEDIVSFANISNGWIYYCNVSDGNRLYKIKTDGTGKTKLSDDVSYYINVIDEKIYYVNASENYSIYKAKIDGKDKERLSNFGRSMYINIGEKWIYFLSNPNEGYALYRIKNDGTENQKVE